MDERLDLVVRHRLLAALRRRSRGGRVGVARDVVDTLLGTLTECGLEPETETAGLAARLRVGRRSTA